MERKDSVFMVVRPGRRGFMSSAMFWRLKKDGYLRWSADTAPTQTPPAGERAGEADEFREVMEDLVGNERCATGRRELDDAIVRTRCGRAQ